MRIVGVTGQTGERSGAYVTSASPSPAHSGAMTSVRLANADHRKMVATHS